MAKLFDKYTRGVYIYTQQHSPPKDILTAC